MITVTYSAFLDIFLRKIQFNVIARNFGKFLGCDLVFKFPLKQKVGIRSFCLLSVGMSNAC